MIIIIESTNRHTHTHILTRNRCTCTLCKCKLKRLTGQNAEDTHIKPEREERKEDRNESNAHSKSTQHSK